MLTIIVLLFYGIWLWNINKEIKKYTELEKKYKVLNKRIKALDNEVFGFDTASTYEEEEPEEEVIEEDED